MKQSKYFITGIYIPSQTVLVHFCDCVLSPGQGLPPFSAFGWLQYLCLV